MDSYYLKEWCEKATSEIVFPPDRKTVAGELLDHMMDHCETLLAEGYDETTARGDTIRAMGDAEEIAPQLAAIHRPFWGYFLRATRILLVVLVLITAVPFYNFMAGRSNAYAQPPAAPYDRYSNTNVYVSENKEGEVTHGIYQEPHRRIKADGCIWELTKVVWEHTEYSDESRDDHDFLCFQIEITDLWPYAWEWPEIRDWMWAQDSEGTVYPPRESGASGGSLAGNRFHTGPFAWTLDMWISGFASQDADWIDICYTRDGRDFRFRIDLPGGDAQ